MADEQIETVKAQYEAVSKRLDIMQDTMDRRFEQWSEDRKELTDIGVSLKTAIAKIDGARDDIADGNKKTMDRIDERLQPIPDLITEAVKNALNAIKPHKWYDVFKRGGEK